MIWVINLLILTAVWVVAVYKRGKIHKFLFFGIVVLEFILLFYLTRQQFFLWYENDLSKFLIPPYKGMGYFIFYSFTRFWLPYLIALTIGLIFFGLAKYLNKKKNYRFFEKEEPYFLAMALFLSGHPGWFLYLGLLLFATLAMVVYKRGERVSFYWLWLPIGILAIILNQFLLKFEWYLGLLL